MFWKSPRNLAAAFTALIAVVAIVLVAALAGDPDDAQDVAVAPTPTASAPQDSTGTAAGLTPTATVIPPLSGPVPDGLQRGALAPGEAPGAKHGVVFVELESGAGELWTLPGAPGAAEYVVDPTHRWIQAFSDRVYEDYGGGPLITDRTTGESFVVNSESWTVLAGPSLDGLLVVGAAIRFPSGEPPRRSDTFVIVDLNTDPTSIAAEIKLPFVPEFDIRATFLDRGARVLLAMQEAGKDTPPGQTLRVFVAEVKTGDVTEVGELPLGLFDFLPTPGGGAAAFSSSGGKDEPRHVSVSRFDAAGARVSEFSVEDGSGPFVHRIRVSPDGRSLAWQEELPLGKPYGAGGVEHWPVVVMADLDTGEVRFRAVRASLTNGIHTLDWLADSSALVVATQEGYGLLGVDRSLTPLPFSPVAHFDPVPAPAPHDASLFAYAGRLVDATGNQLGPDIAAASWVGSGLTEGYGFNDAGTELRLQRSLPFGRDFGPGGVSTMSLPVRIETPPFTETTRLRVATGGDNLNLRALPGVTEEVVGQLVDGAQVTVSGDGTNNNCSEDAGCSVASDPDLEYDEAWWLYVVANDGLEGWVRSDFLTWAD